MKIDFEGVTHEFPDDFTPAEISAALHQSSKPDISRQQIQQHNNILAKNAVDAAAAHELASNPLLYSAKYLGEVMDTNPVTAGLKAGALSTVAGMGSLVGEMRGQPRSVYSEYKDELNRKVAPMEEKYPYITGLSELAGGALPFGFTSIPGKLGINAIERLGGTMLTASPTTLLPRAAIGATIGAAQPISEDQSRAVSAVLGSALNIGAGTVGDISQGLSSALQVPKGYKLPAAIAEMLPTTKSIKSAAKAKTVAEISPILKYADKITSNESLLGTGTLGSIYTGNLIPILSAVGTKVAKKALQTNIDNEKMKQALLANIVRRNSVMSKITQNKNPEMPAELFNITDIIPSNMQGYGPAAINEYVLGKTE